MFARETLAVLLRSVFPPLNSVQKKAQFCTPVLTTEVLRPISKGSSMTATKKSLRVCKAWRQQFE